MSSQSKQAAFEERRSVVAVFGMRIMKLQWGWPGASVTLQRPRTAMPRSAEPIGGDAMFEERGAASERKLARLAVARSAPPWTSSLANRQKKGADLRRVMAGADPEWCRYAAARRTGIPILRALSTRLLVMPDPGKARRPFGRKFSRTSLRRKGAALPSRSQFGLQTTNLTAE